MCLAEGHYYVYFYRDDCRYCQNIESEIDDFAKAVKLYKINSDSLLNTKRYDWDGHAAKFDVEIGRINENGSIQYYHDLNEKDIMEAFSPVNYNIVLATEGYVAMHDEKEEGKVYAISTHPILYEDDLKEGNFVLPGIPLLIEIDNKKIVSYYFDDKEIIDYLGSKTTPLGKYWNIN